MTPAMCQIAVAPEHSECNGIIHAHLEELDQALVAVHVLQPHHFSYKAQQCTSTDIPLILSDVLNHHCYGLDTTQ